MDAEHGVMDAELRVSLACCSLRRVAHFGRNPHRPQPLAGTGLPARCGCRAQLRGHRFLTAHIGRCPIKPRACQARVARSERDSRAQERAGSGEPSEVGGTTAAERWSPGLATRCAGREALVDWSRMAAQAQTCASAAAPPEGQWPGSYVNLRTVLRSRVSSKKTLRRL